MKVKLICPKLRNDWNIVFWSNISLANYCHLVLLLEEKVNRNCGINETVFSELNYHWHSFSASVLWCCWLGGRKGIRPVKHWVVGCWRGYLSGVRCKCSVDVVVKYHWLPTTSTTTQYDIMMSSNWSNVSLTRNLSSHFDMQTHASSTIQNRATLTLTFPLICPFLQGRRRHKNLRLFKRA